MAILHSPAPVRWAFLFTTCIGLGIVQTGPGRSQSVSPFPDVSVDHAAFQAVQGLRQAGILAGYTGGQGRTSSGTRAQEKTISISIEGMPEPIRFRLFDEAGLPFTTYFPKDMIADITSKGKGESVRFAANFGGKRNNKAALHIFFLRQGITQQTVYSTLRAAVTSRGIRSPRPLAKRLYSWSIREYSLTTRERRGWIALGKHKGRYFYIINEYPTEYEEGLGPRVEQILQEWQWRDTGQRLSAKG